MKQIGLLLTSLPFATNSCFYRPDSELLITKYDGQVVGVAYNHDDPSQADEKSTADIVVENGKFVHVQLETSRKIGGSWIVTGSWDPHYDNFGTPTLHSDAAQRYAGQIQPADYNDEAQQWIDAGNLDKDFYEGANQVHQSMFNFSADDGDLYYYQISRYAIFIRNNIMYASIIGSETSRQTYEAMVDLTPYLDAENKIIDGIRVGDAFDWRLNGEQTAFGYKGDVAETPFQEIDGSITRNGIFRDLSDEIDLDEFIGLIGLYCDKDDWTITDKEIYGRHSLGGWAGNYQSINEYFKGKSVQSYSSLWDRLNIGDSIPGEDGIKDIANGIAGATVEVTRENGAFQDALIKLGLDIQRDGIKWN